MMMMMKVQFNDCSACSINPSNSADLNPVYCAIRDALQQIVYHERSFASCDELKRAIIDA